MANRLAERALKTLQALQKAGIDMGRITGELENAGVKAFADAFRRMIDGIAVKARKLSSRAPAAGSGDAKRAMAELSAERAVERLWAKDPSLWKQEEAHKKIISNSLGWLRMPKEMASRTQELLEFAGEIRKAGLRRAVLLGMGGSSLAPEVFRRTFPAKPGFPALSVLDSTDPEAVLSTDKENDPKTTLYIVSSKSGTTTEPLRLFDYFWGRAESALAGSAGMHFIAITDPGSFLEGQAKERKFRRVFRNFPDIGGRFSALSYFGLVPATLLGIDVQELLRRASVMAEACAQDGEGNPGLRLGAQLAAHASAGRDKITLLMSPEIESLGLWLEQLMAESTGKEGQGVVPVAGEPLSAPEDYSRDRVFVLTSLRSSSSSAPEKLAGELEAAGHPVIRLELLDELDICAEFFRWEIATALLGRRLGIDPFDQPDVQSAKDKTKAVLDVRAKTGRLPSIQADSAEPGLKLSFSLAAKGALSLDERASLDASLARFLSSAKPGDYLGLLAFVSPRGGYGEPMRSLAQALRAASPAALQTGYGPRYLHSTGQLHKGGPNSGLFIVLAREDAADAPIPGCAYGFADLVNAQALGDFQALDSAARRAVLVRFAGDPRKAFKRLEVAVRAEVDRKGVKAVKS
ncbi:MAG: glucose-6-phosphate isomerase [Elusimicrobia bacterium]|nr:glucose-6-phosphate isomerase [Elusimicrobiota bacterium]